MAMGYGESATGYIPTELQFAEDDANLHDWCWVSPGAEEGADRGSATGAFILLSELFPSPWLKLVPTDSDPENFGPLK